MIRFVQLKHPKQGRRVAVVQGEKLRLLRLWRALFDLASTAITKKKSLADLAAGSLSNEILDYDAVYFGSSAWKFLPAFDHPDESARCLVTGTGLTHQASAKNRQAMHSAKKSAWTDSMKMYQWGVEGGRPKPGKIGVPPEWFYKGHGDILRAHNEPLDVPSFGGDGGDEAEVAGAYIIDSAGRPHRVGLVLGNEFSDHVIERKNYLYLAPSKLRCCSLGPELMVDADFSEAHGTVKILRKGKVIWSSGFTTGEKNMSHTVANLEHHHFKYPQHRRPGDAHIHFFGADVFSFGSNIKLKDGDVMEIELPGFGRPLRNPIKMDRSKAQFVKVPSL